MPPNYLSPIKKSCKRALTNQSHIPAIDGLRGFAVLAVIFCHLFPKVERPSHWLEQFYNGIVEVGWSGVDLFFVLSGFLITSILFKNKFSRNYFSSFYARRILRIVPLYYILCVTVIFLLPSLRAYLSLDSRQVVGNPIYYFLFLNNFSAFLTIPKYTFLGVTWSLAIEEQFYLFWPLLIRRIDADKMLALCLSLLVAIVSLKNLLYLRYGVSTEALYIFTITHLDGILIGSIAAIILSDRSRHRFWIKLFSNQYLFTGPILAGVFVFCIFSPVGQLHLSLQPPMVLVGNTLCALMYCSLLLHCVLRRSSVTSFFQSPTLMRFGKYSYAMYLLHIPAASVSNSIIRSAQLTELLNNTPLPFVCSLAITYVLSKLSWFVLESRFNALKKHFVF